MEEIERLRRTVDDTPFLARAKDPRATITRAPLDVGGELRAVADYLEALAREREVALVVDGSTGATMAVDGTLFRRALVHLMTNAVPSHLRAVGWRSRVGRPTRARLSRPGTPARECRPRYSHAFSSGTSARREHSGRSRGEGAGLGLAILRGILYLHRGTAEVDSRPGVGTCITLRFPGTRDSTSGAPRLARSRSGAGNTTERRPAWVRRDRPPSGTCGYRGGAAAQQQDSCLATACATVTLRRRW